MGYEIERKFLIRGEIGSLLQGGVKMCQGYLSVDPARTVRVRIEGDVAFLTIKGKTHGMKRQEVEIPLEVEQAQELLGLCVPGMIEKTRYRIPQGELAWELDVFEGANEGLVVAEMEIPHEEYTFEMPEWVGQEVTDDERYYNSALVENPYCHWRDV